MTGPIPITYLTRHLSRDSILVPLGCQGLAGAGMDAALTFLGPAVASMRAGGALKDRLP